MNSPSRSAADAAPFEGCALPCLLLSAQEAQGKSTFNAQHSSAFGAIKPHDHHWCSMHTCVE